MLWFLSFKILVQKSNGMLAMHQLNFSSQQKLWWRQQWRTKLGVTLEPCLLPCLCPSLVSKKSNQEGRKKKDCGVKRLQFPVLVCPIQHAIRHVSSWSGSCCSLEILSYWQTPQKGWTLMAQAAASLPRSCLHLVSKTTFFWGLPFSYPSFHCCYSCQQSPAGPEILWVNGLPQSPYGSCFGADNKKKSISFLRYCMPVNTTVKKSKNVK